MLHRSIKRNFSVAQANIAQDEEHSQQKGESDQQPGIWPKGPACPEKWPSLIDGEHTGRQRGGNARNGKAKDVALAEIPAYMQPNGEAEIASQKVAEAEK